MMSVNDNNILYSTTSYIHVGIPSVPNVPYLISSSDNIASVELSTNYSGVHDPTVDDFTFILHVCNIISCSYNNLRYIYTLYTDCKLHQQ